MKSEQNNKLKTKVNIHSSNDSLIINDLKKLGFDSNTEKLESSLTQVKKGKKKKKSKNKDLDGVYCSKCLNLNPGNTEVICKFCGYKLCPQCQSSLKKQDNVCPNCSKKIKNVINSSQQDTSININEEGELDIKKDKLKEFHLKVIKNYHVKICKSNSENRCPYDFFKCFDSHESSYLRRKPFLIKNSQNQTTWNYIPEMCNYFLSQNSCSNSINCHFSHNNDEVFYHPEKFKKTHCNYNYINTICARGKFCFRAHGKKDFFNNDNSNDFIASKENIKTGNNYVNKNFKEFSKDEKNKLENRRRNIQIVNLSKNTVYNATTDLNFYMFEYKTKPCLNAPCINMRCCTNYHHDQERRRSPKDFQYSAEPCPEVKLSSMQNATTKWREPSRCEKLVLCKFSHTLLEQMYHPHIYKTSLCSNYSGDSYKLENENKQNCLWGNLCTHAHGKNNLRIRSDQSKIFIYSEFKKQEKKLKMATENKISPPKTQKMIEPIKPININYLNNNNFEKKNTSSDQKNNKIMSFSEALRSGSSNSKDYNQTQQINEESKVSSKKVKKTFSHLKPININVSEQQNKNNVPQKKLISQFSIKPENIKNNKNNALIAEERKIDLSSDELDRTKLQDQRSYNYWKGFDVMGNEDKTNPKIEKPKTKKRSNNTSKPPTDFKNPPKTYPFSQGKKYPYEKNWNLSPPLINVKQIFSPIIGGNDKNKSSSDSKNFSVRRSAVSMTQQPLKIVQDSPMYKLCGNKKKQQSDGLVIDYKELFENLRKRYLCPICKSPKAVRDRVLIPCGHFFCEECVSKLLEKKSMQIERESKCMYCNKQIERVFILQFE